jgi:hypothetical protein
MALAADHNCKSLTSLLLRPKIFLCSCHTFQWSTSTFSRSQDTAIILWALQPGAPVPLVVHRLWAQVRKPNSGLGRIAESCLIANRRCTRQAQAGPWRVLRLLAVFTRTPFPWLSGGSSHLDSSEACKAHRLTIQQGREQNLFYAIDLFHLPELWLYHMFAWLCRVLQPAENVPCSCRVSGHLHASSASRAAPHRFCASAAKVGLPSHTMYTGGSSIGMLNAMKVL